MKIRIEKTSDIISYSHVVVHNKIDKNFALEIWEALWKAAEYCDLEARLHPCIMLLRIRLCCHQCFTSTYVTPWKDEVRNHKCISMFKFLSRFNFQAKMSVFKDGQEAAYIKFNASSLGKTSWFSRSRIVDTSYPDLQSTKANFILHKYVLPWLQQGNIKPAGSVEVE